MTVRTHPRPPDGYVSQTEAADQGDGPGPVGGHGALQYRYGQFESLSYKVRDADGIELWRISLMICDRLLTKRPH